MSHSEASNLIVFSVACGGQNHNINLVCMWMYIVENPGFSYRVVNHKFTIPGHSFLPNDRDFGLIEKTSRYTQHVYIPENCYTLVEAARRNNPFNVTRMEMGDFVLVEHIRSAIVY